MQGSLFVAVNGVEEDTLQAELKYVAGAFRMPAPARWKESPFAEFKGRSPSAVGVLFERLVSAFLARQGLYVERRKNGQHDRVINGLRCEIKGSTVTPAGFFRFNQLRQGQDYSHVIMLGLTPTLARMWVETRDDAGRVSIAEHNPGAEGAESVRGLFVRPDWIGPGSNGTLVDALRVLRQGG